MTLTTLVEAGVRLGIPALAAVVILFVLVRGEFVFRYPRQERRPSTSEPVEVSSSGEIRT